VCKGGGVGVGLATAATLHRLRLWAVTRARTVRVLRERLGRMVVLATRARQTITAWVVQRPRPVLPTPTRRCLPL
jgi:hypothetical protein